MNQKDEQFEHCLAEKSCLQNEINCQNSEMLELDEEVKKLTEKVQEYEEHKSKNVQNYQKDYDALFAQVQGYIYVLG